MRLARIAGCAVERREIRVDLGIARGDRRRLLQERARLAPIPYAHVCPSQILREEALNVLKAYAADPTRVKY